MSKNPYSEHRLQRAKRAISNRADVENPDLDPTRQDAIDRNEGPGPRPERAAPSKRRPDTLDEEE